MRQGYRGDARPAAASSGQARAGPLGFALNRSVDAPRAMFRYHGPIADERRNKVTSKETAMPMLIPTADDAVVTVYSHAYWIARTHVRCFSCLQLSSILGLFFQTASAVGRQEWDSPRPASPSNQARCFQLIFVRRISAATLED